MNSLKKKIFFGFGVIFFGLGVFGYYMPLIPGTIFMILSAYCFMYSSKRLYNKIINHPNLEKLNIVMMRLYLTQILKIKEHLFQL